MVFNCLGCRAAGNAFFFSFVISARSQFVSIEDGSSKCGIEIKMTRNKSIFEGFREITTGVGCWTKSGLASESTSFVVSFESSECHGLWVIAKPLITYLLCHKSSYHFYVALWLENVVKVEFSLRQHQKETRKRFFRWATSCRRWSGFFSLMIVKRFHFSRIIDYTSTAIWDGNNMNYSSRVEQSMEARPRFSVVAQKF